MLLIHCPGSGVPSDISRRNVRIYRPANTPTQSGSARSNHWKIDFDTQERWENPLLGWSSSADPVQSLSLKFNTKEEAITFAERQGYDYWIDLPKEPVFKVKQYAENFKVCVTFSMFKLLMFFLLSLLLLLFILINFNLLVLS